MEYGALEDLKRFLDDCSEVKIASRIVVEDKIERNRFHDGDHGAFDFAALFSEFAPHRYNNRISPEQLFELLKKALASAEEIE